MAKKKLTPAMRTALWNIQRDGGLMLTLGAEVDSPYTTRKGRVISAATVSGLIARDELVAEDTGLLGSQPTAWQVAHPVDVTPV